MILKNPLTYRVLDMSTKHLTAEDSDTLERDIRSGATAYALEEYGFLVYVGMRRDPWAHTSDNFRAILEEARVLGCQYVRFDWEGRVYPELPIFDW